MIGVILWSDRSRERAIIWCEDHAALAYLQGRENLVTPEFWPEAGDLVELESENVDQHRLARHVSLISPHHRSNLPQMLRDMDAPETSAKPNLRVISTAGEVPGMLPQPLKVAAAG